MRKLILTLSTVAVVSCAHARAISDTPVPNAVPSPWDATTITVAKLLVIAELESLGIQTSQDRYIVVKFYMPGDLGSPGYSLCEHDGCEIRVELRKHIASTALMGELLRSYLFLFGGRKEEYFCDPPQRCKETKLEAELFAVYERL